MAKLTIDVEITLAWWVRPFLLMGALSRALMRRPELVTDRMWDFARKGLKTRIVD